MSAPVKHTCPDIDASIKRLKDIILSCRDIEDSSLRRDIEWEADYVIDELEKLRKANAVLRDWGEELEKELQDAHDEIYSLEEELKLKELSHE